MILCESLFLTVAIELCSERRSPYSILFFSYRKMPYKKHHPETISAIQGPLKLATKYKMGLLRERFVSMLRVDWPSELSKYDQRRADLNNPSWHQAVDRDSAWPQLCSDPGMPSYFIVRHT